MRSKIDLPAEFYLDLIKTSKPFSLSRFGDGEVLCMFHNGWLHENCDGSKFLDELIEPMKQIFRNQYPYYHCILDCSFDLNGDKFTEFVEQTCPDMPLYNGEIWQHLSFSDRITELVEALSLHQPVFIGASHLSKVSKMNSIGDISHILTPDRDSYKSFNRIFDDCMKYHEIGHRFFAFACGYTSKILIDTLFPYIGHDSFLVDFGSVFDPYCGVLSRDGMRFAGFSKFQPFTKYQL